MLDILDYDTRWGAYRLKLSAVDLTKRKDTVSSLLQKAYELFW